MRVFSNVTSVKESMLSCRTSTIASAYRNFWIIITTSRPYVLLCRLKRRQHPQSPYGNIPRRGLRDLSSHVLSPPFLPFPQAPIRFVQTRFDVVEPFFIIVITIVMFTSLRVLLLRNSLRLVTFRIDAMSRCSLTCRTCV